MVKDENNEPVWPVSEPLPLAAFDRATSVTTVMRRPDRGPVVSGRDGQEENHDICHLQQVVRAHSVIPFGSPAAGNMANS
jgi:hypothetical protein